MLRISKNVQNSKNRIKKHILNPNFFKKLNFFFQIVNIFKNLKFVQLQKSSQIQKLLEFEICSNPKIFKFEICSNLKIYSH
jgi:hypothetical protein